MVRKKYTIDLSDNNLIYISKHLFSNIRHVYILNVKHNLLMHLQMDIFINWPVTVTFTNDFHICCFTLSEMFCTATKPWYASCSRLLPSFGVKVSIITVSIILLICNFLSLFRNVRVVVKRQQSSLFSIIVCFLNIGDMLCGLYLLILCAGDLYFGETFVVNDHEWRSGTPCSIAYITILTFSLIIPYLLSVLSLARLMVVIYPFQSRFKSTNFVYKYTFGGFAITGALALVSCAKLQIKQSIPTILCSPFIDPKHSIHDIKFLTFFVASIQF